MGLLSAKERGDTRFFFHKSPLKFPGDPTCLGESCGGEGQVNEVVGNGLLMRKLTEQNFLTQNHIAENDQGQLLPAQTVGDVT